MFNMPTSGPLSPIVSLERRKLEQQGIPPGQEQQGSAAKGAPISGDLAQLIQLNRMIQQQGAMQQQANPAPSTVAQDLMQRAGQQMQPQMPPQMQQMAPQMDPRQQGIAQLPQEAVGNGMAEGGIVAFDDGGSVRHFAGGGDIEAEIAKLEESIRADDYIKQGVGGSLGRMISSRTMPMGYADRKAAEARLNQLKSASSMFAGAPTSTPALSSPLAIPGDAYAPPPGKIGAPPVPPEVKQAIAQIAAASGKGQGLKDLVPTLSAPKEEPKKEAPPSESDMLLTKMKTGAAKTAEDFAAERNKVYEGVGLPAIWKKQQEEQERLKAQNNPAARNKAFWDNLSEQLAGQIGQRGVPLSSRLAQMVGAYGTARSATNKETKKLEAELNKAANDLQEKQAIFRANGSFEALKDFERAQKDYAAAVKESETVKAQARRDEIAEQRYNEDRKFREMELKQRGQIAQADREARVTNASMAAAVKSQMSPAEYSRVYADSQKVVDTRDGMGLARAAVAKAANMGKGKIPAPGADKDFDALVDKQYRRMIEEELAARLYRVGGPMVGMGAPVPLAE